MALLNAVLTAEVSLGGSCTHYSNNPTFNDIEGSLNISKVHQSSLEARLNCLMRGGGLVEIKLDTDTVPN